MAEEASAGVLWQSSSGAGNKLEVLEAPQANASPEMLIPYSSSFWVAAHIPGKLNIAADAVSRNNLPLFHLQFPEINTLSSSIPRAVVSLVIY